MKLALLLLSVLTLSGSAAAQSFPPATDTFTGGTFTASQNQVLYVSNQTGPGNLIRLGASASVIFDGAYTGQLQIIGFPTIYTKAGSNVQITNGLPEPWQATGFIQPTIYNYGQLQARSLLMGNLSFTFNFGTLVIDSLLFADVLPYAAPPGKVYNFGAINAGYTRLAADSQSYLGFTASSLVTGTLVIDTANGVVGPTCVKVTNELVVNAPLTNNANVSVILDPGTVVVNPNNIPLGGTMASPGINCSQVGVPLPMTIYYFEARSEEGFARLDWSAEGQVRLQYSDDGRTFGDVSNLRSGYHRQPLSAGLNYFRLSVLDGDRWTYSRTVVLKYEDSGPVPVEYYDLNGHRLPAAPVSGFYIRRQGGVVTKLMKY